MRNDAPSIASVDNALQVLLLLAERQRLRVVDVADYLGVARSTAHRTLSALLQRGFVIQDASKVYRPGSAFDQLAHPGAVGVPELREVLRPHLEGLARAVGETCHLAVLEGNGTRFVDCVESPQVLRVGSRVGMLLPAHSNSIGKVLLAELTPAAFYALYPRGLPGERATAAARRVALQRQLTTIRKRGYAINSGESEKGIVAVGACVRDAAGRALAGIAIACPAPRCPRSRLPELIDAVLSTVAAAKRDL
jgi:DNA-binding IclR family transcriptional regulator